MRTSALAIATPWHGRPARDRGTDALVRHRADIPETLFSLDALIDSIKILRDKTGVKYKDGVCDEVLMKPYTIPSKILAENERWKDGSRKFAWNDKTGENALRTAFTQILEFCAVRGIKLGIFTNPLHAEMLDIEYGNGDTFSQWAQWLGESLVVEFGTARDRPLQYVTIPFHNYYHFRAGNSEPFPSPTDKVSAMQSYCEISHFRKAVGDRVLTEMMKNEHLSQGDWLETLKAERAQWKETR